MRGPGGRKIAGDYRVSVFDRPRRFVFEVIAGPARPRGRFDIAAGGPLRTTVTFTMEVEPGGLMRLLSPMIAKQVGKEVEAVANMKRVKPAVELFGALVTPYFQTEQRRTRTLDLRGWRLQRVQTWCR
jgi:hypothetical protein